MHHPPPDDIPTISPDMFERIDFEKGMSLVPWVTVGLMLSCIVIFVCELSQGALRNEDAIIAAGAMHKPKVDEGEVWRLLSAVFLHGGIDHLIGNLIALYILGLACEHALGRAQMLTIFVYSGVISSGASYFGELPSVGASGAIFGICGAVIVFFARHHKLYHSRNAQIGWMVLGWGGYMIAQGFLNPFVDNRAHVGGLIGGFLVALPMRPVLREANSSVGTPRPFAILGMMSSVVLLLVTAGFFLPKLMGR